MKIVYIVCFLFICTASMASSEKSTQVKSEERKDDTGHAGDDNAHEGHEKHEGEKKHDVGENSNSHKEHESHEEHDEVAEENPQVGEGKGITAASPDEGIKISPEAFKNFEIETMKIQNINNIVIPRKAIVTAGEEINIFRFRQGFYKRVDFEFVKKETSSVTIKSKELIVGDEIVVAGMGFLRIAEIAAFGGAPEGHSH